MARALYLGIETSCDETAAAVVADGRFILSSVIESQTATHQAFGGVVPEVAARQHVETLNQVVSEALSKADVKPEELAGVACTNGPGLIGTLLVGLSAAKALSWVWDKPLLTVDHLLAHVCANYINTDLEPPFIALLVSGGHTQIIHFKSYSQGEILGQTLDDAAGEAFDKVGRLLGLPYPGGPSIDKTAEAGNRDAFAFPEGAVAGYDFSFSGLKTAVLRTVQKLPKPLPTADLAASFQWAVVKVLVRKTLLAQKNVEAQRVVIAGGVAANSLLRSHMKAQSQVPVYVPSISLCTDNAAMVAAAAHFCGQPAQLDARAYSRR
jgi:N6-L-threonylcarbamoyladenine synthase